MVDQSAFSAATLSRTTTCNAAVSGTSLIVHYKQGDTKFSVCVTREYGNSRNCGTPLLLPPHVEQIVLVFCGENQTLEAYFELE